jgi:HTH-type transcriptional regulator / antitoxin HipB
MNTKQIGQAIRLRRKELRITQEQLADLAECSKPFVIAAEAGKPTMRLDKLISVLSVLGLVLNVEEAAWPE